MKNGSEIWKTKGQNSMAPFYFKQTERKFEIRLDETAKRSNFFKIPNS